MQLNCRMTLREFLWKVKKTVHRRRVFQSNWKDNYEQYCLKYASYRYMKLHPNCGHQRDKNYFAARPNPGAGIGHQIANWIAGYWFAKQFNLNFAHIPFSGQRAPFVANEWDAFLGFGDGEVSYSDLKRKGYKTVLLPLFAEENTEHIEIIRNIIKAYSDQKVVFLAEQDQFYRDQFGVLPEIQDKFFHAQARNQDKLVYSKEHYNIAIHARRGDIIQNNGENNPNLTMRYQSMDYFINVLDEILQRVRSEKDVYIYIFSQGEDAEFLPFMRYRNVFICNQMGAMESFLHMVYADILITSKSSFSYKPALLNKDGIKVCPEKFWHGYPNDEKWWLASEEGKILEKK